MRLACLGVATLILVAMVGADYCDCKVKEFYADEDDGHWGCGQHIAAPQKDFAPCSPSRRQHGPPRQCFAGDCALNGCWREMVPSPEGCDGYYVHAPYGKPCFGSMGRCFKGTCLRPDVYLMYSDLVLYDKERTEEYNKYTLGLESVLRFLHTFPPIDCSYPEDDECDYATSRVARLGPPMGSAGDRDCYETFSEPRAATKGYASYRVSLHRDGTKCAGDNGECLQGRCYTRTGIAPPVETWPTDAQYFPS